ncbi:hypothetical protein BRD00_02205 [Halobacteriales archaeon QS_8_69_26]|nr:MAG: hypothetical protein BRD00_02205 [Halobacteriales archaeon QS_8_69_26]
MATNKHDRVARDLLPGRQTLLVLGGLLIAEFLAVVWYFALTDSAPTGLRYLVYPFVWINVGLLAAWHTSPAPASARDRRIAAALAAGYALLLAYFGGVIGPGTALGGGPVFGLSVHFVSPGWGPALVYGGEYLQVAVIPFEAIGYAALVYLVYATIIDATGAAVSGVLGLLSCVSCSWPIVASLVTGAVGGSGAAIAVSASYDLSTLVFVVTVALLFWRPFER